jgi:hypothetical protein
MGGLISRKIQTDFSAMSRLGGARAICSAAYVPLSAGVFARGPQENQPMTIRRCFDHRNSMLRSFSPTERITYAKWKRGVAAFYTSVALLTVISVAYFNYRGDGAANQTVNLRLLQIN